MSTKQVHMMCPNLHCRQLLAVPEIARGKIVRCGACGTNTRVPMPNENRLSVNTKKQDKSSEPQPE